VITPFGSMGGSQVTSKELVFVITFLMTGSPGTKKNKTVIKGFRQRPLQSKIITHVTPVFVVAVRD